MQEHTLVGRPDAPKAQDIQLSGLGIMLEHCILDMEDQDVFITPLDGARFVLADEKEKIKQEKYEQHKKWNMNSTMSFSHISRL